MFYWKVYFTCCNIYLWEGVFYLLQYVSMGKGKVIFIAQVGKKG
jgi:hypothetical protein